MSAFCGREIIRFFLYQQKILDVDICAVAELLCSGARRLEYY